MNTESQQRCDRCKVNNVDNTIEKKSVENKANHFTLYYQSKSNKNPYGNKTNGTLHNIIVMSKSNKNPYGNKTSDNVFSVNLLSKSNKNPYGNKT